MTRKVFLCYSDKDRKLVDELAEQGWTFELAPRRDPPPRTHLHAPCSTVMIAARPGGLPELNVEAHELGLVGLLDRVWNNPGRKSFFRSARTPQDALELLAEEPRLVYVYAHARDGARGPELLLEDGAGEPAPLPFAELAAACGRRPPQILFLNTTGAVALAPPAPGVALVAHLRWESAS